MPDLPRYVRVADAAAMLSVTPDKITDLIRSGQLAAVDVSLHRGGKARWRIAVAELEAFLTSRRTSPPAPRPPRRQRTTGYQRKYY